MQKNKINILLSSVIILAFLTVSTSTLAMLEVPLPLDPGSNDPIPQREGSSYKDHDGFSGDTITNPRSAINLYKFMAKSIIAGLAIRYIAYPVYS